MPDHPTAIILKTHVADPVPFVLYSAEAPQNNGNVGYNEKGRAQNRYCGKEGSSTDGSADRREAHVDRNPALEAVRVTGAAALNCAHWTGRGDEKAADQAAVDAMRKAFDALADRRHRGDRRRRARRSADALYRRRKSAHGGPKVDIAARSARGHDDLAPPARPTRSPVIAHGRRRQSASLPGHLHGQDRRRSGR